MKDAHRFRGSISDVPQPAAPISTEFIDEGGLEQQKRRNSDGAVLATVPSMQLQPERASATSAPSSSPSSVALNKLLGADHPPESCLIANRALSVFLHETSLGREMMLSRLRSGGLFLKHGARGSPHYRLVRCTDDLSAVTWSEISISKDKAKDKDTVKDKALRGRIWTADIVSVDSGHSSRIFRDRAPKSSVPAHCFSLRSKERTLDLECCSEMEAEEWKLAFKFLLEYTRDAAIAAEAAALQAKNDAAAAAEVNLAKNAEAADASISIASVTHLHSDSTDSLLSLNSGRGDGGAGGSGSGSRSQSRRTSVSFVSALDVLCSQSDAFGSAPSTPSCSHSMMNPNDATNTTAEGSLCLCCSSCQVEHSLELTLRDDDELVRDAYQDLGQLVRCAPAAPPQLSPPQQQPQPLPPQLPAVECQLQRSPLLSLPSSDGTNSLQTLQAPLPPQQPHARPPLSSITESCELAAGAQSSSPAIVLQQRQQQQQHQPSGHAIQPASVDPAAMQLEIEFHKLSQLNQQQRGFTPQNPLLPSALPLLPEVAPSAAVNAAGSMDAVGGGGQPLSLADLSTPFLLDPSQFAHQDIFDAQTFAHLAAETAAEYGRGPLVCFPSEPQQHPSMRLSDAALHDLGAAGGLNDFAAAAAASSAPMMSSEPLAAEQQECDALLLRLHDAERRAALASDPRLSRMARHIASYRSERGMLEESFSAKMAKLELELADLVRRNDNLARLRIEMDAAAAAAAATAATACSKVSASASPSLSSATRQSQRDESEQPFFRHRNALEDVANGKEQTDPVVPSPEFVLWSSPLDTANATIIPQ
jgi:hypothetical protein